MVIKAHICILNYLYAIVNILICNQISILNSLFNYYIINIEIWNRNVDIINIKAWLIKSMINYINTFQIDKHEYGKNIKICYKYNKAGRYDAIEWNDNNVMCIIWKTMNFKQQNVFIIIVIAYEWILAICLVIEKIIQYIW